MKKSILLLFTLVGGALCLCSYKFEVKGWFLAGSDPGSYEIGVEESAGRTGKVGYLKSTKLPNGFGTIMQGFSPKDYLGKRVRMTGYIKSKDVTDWAGMWFRIDGSDKKSLGFDNMQSRPIKGNTDWQKYSIVLDVPSKSQHFAFGVLLSGPGQIWLDDIAFEEVDKSVPVTTAGEKPDNNKPQNLNFDDSGK